MENVCEEMIAYKLVKQRKDGSIGPLFINAKLVIPIGEWLEAEDHPTNGFAHRPGWHCTLKPVAPHLKEVLASGERRQWWRVAISDYKTYDRPESQGGTWVLAKRIKFVSPC